MLRLRKKTKLRFLSYFICTNVLPVYMSVCTTYMHCPRASELESDPLGLESGIVATCGVGAGNQNLAPRRALSDVNCRTLSSSPGKQV